MRKLAFAAVAVLIPASALADGIVPHPECEDTLTGRCAAPENPVTIEVFATSMSAAGFTTLTPEEMIDYNSWSGATVDDEIPAGTMVRL